MGIVYLVGAGCGDASLLTIKGRDCIAKADCIFYDRLIDPRILEFAKKDCQKIYVGKENQHHVVPQEKINEQLIQAAERYGVVVRLKGGDPYVFGRGGEEALALKQHGIQFEVVPGISSAIGGLAYAGIPVTHRGFTKGVRIYTAHTKKDECTKFDFAELAHTDDTLIFLMGLRSAYEICAQLLQTGKAADTPVAICSHVSMSDQHCVTTSLAQIAQEDLSSLTSPAIIVVGKVVSLREDLCFFEKKPLFQKRYLLMKVSKEAHYVAEQLRLSGAAIEEVQCGDCQAIPHAWDVAEFMKYTYIIFTSANAVRIFMTQLYDAGLDSRVLANIKICALGKATAEHLLSYGLRADIIPKVYDSEHLVQCLVPVLNQNDHILIPKAENQNTLLQDFLSQHCLVDCIAIYKMEATEVTIPHQIYDGIIITCSFSAKQLGTYWKGTRDIPVYVIGARTKHTCEKQGFTNIIQLPQADVHLFVPTILKELKLCIEEED